MNKSALSNKKCEWKKRTKRIQFECERLFIRARAGGIVTLGEIYQLGHRIHRLGEAGVDISQQASELCMSDRVLEDIGNECHYLEQASTALRGLLHRRRMYVSTFPMWESPLQYHVVVEPDDAIDALNQLLGGTHEQEGHGD